MKNKVLKTLTILNILSSLYFIIFAISNQIIPNNYKMIIAAALFVNIAVSEIIFFKSAKILSLKYILIPILLIIIITNLLLSHTLNKSVSSLDKIQENPKNEISKESEDKINRNEPFLLYFSGIDSYGEIDKVSRTDADILMAIRPEDKRILMVSIPRDSYVRIAGKGQNQFDKLTHSGIYGIDSTVETINNLFGVNIDYYFRVNFTSVEKIVDLLGGIDVENDYTFKAFNGNDFPKGTVHLNGKETLAFARERHSFKDGDIQRGRNQQKVLSALIKKAIKPSIILNIDNYFEIFEKYVRTNMPKEKMYKLVNTELSNKGSWDIENITLKGHGAMGLKSHAMPGSNLYMYVPNEDSVREISDRLEKHLENDIEHKENN